MEEYKTDGFDGELSTIIPDMILDKLTQISLVNDLYVYQIGYYPKASNHKKERTEGANEFILKYCVTGVAYYEINGKKYKVDPNSYFIIPKNVPHKYWADKKDPWGVYWIHFKGEKANEIYRLFYNIKQGAPVNIEFNQKRIKIFEEILEILLSGFSDENLVYANISLFHFLGSFVYADKFDYIVSNNQKTLRDKLIHIMKNNLHRNLTLNEFAKEANYSVSHLCLVFKKETGIPLMDYFSHLKIQRACQYLAHTGMSVKEIGLSVGFEDALYFSRVFSKVMNTNPRAYRKSAKHGE